MRTILKIITLVIAFNIASFVYANEKPIMVIRFNKPVVNYQNSLSMVKQAAISKKPEVFFDVVSITPENLKDKDTIKLYNYQAQEIVEELKYMGINEDKIRLTFQKKPDLKYNEVHLFVR